MGAQQLLQQAVSHEAAEDLERHATHVDERGHRQVVGNGRMPERELTTPVGRVKIQRPRVDDRRPGHKFPRHILRPDLHRTPSLDALIPALDLRGESTGDFTEALAAILGPQAAGLSPANIVRLKEGWQTEYQAWQERGLADKRYVYWWGDGIYFTVRLERFQ